MVSQMTDNQKMDTRDKILQAAKEIFIKKGRDGARMQEIADRAGVNKAMLFYYYSNKDFLYKEVLKKNLSQIFSQVRGIIISESEPRKKIEQFVNAYVNFISNNRDLPKIILREVASGGENIKKAVDEIKENMEIDYQSTLASLFQQRGDSTQFRDVDPRQTIMSIVGMCLIYFIGKPMFDAILGLSEIDEYQYIEERKKSIIDLLEHGILVRNNND